MKNFIFLLFLSIIKLTTAQEHFGGINFSSRTGVLNGIQNPAELSNLDSNFEFQFFATSFAVSNNKISTDDFFGNKNFEEIIFEGDEAVDLRFDGEILGPGVAFKFNKWAFGINSRAFIKFNLIDIDANIGDAIANTSLNSLSGSNAILLSDENQRINGVSWGEIGLSAARNLIKTDRSSLSVGATFKLLFPGSYANFGLSKLAGTINKIGSTSFLNDVDNVNVNIQYSGNLGDDLTSDSDYYQSLFGRLNGFGVDLGINYRWKNPNNDNKKNYLVNAGFAIKNIGNMTFKDANNSSTNYNLNIESTLQNPNGLDLLQFENVTSLQEVEQILTESGYLFGNKINSEFNIQLPTTINLYADVKIIHSLFVTLYTQQKINDDNENSQITTQNIFSITPRLTGNTFEIYSTWAANEISGLTGGVGFRLGGFFIGSNSIISSYVGNAKQLDFYLGLRMGL